MTERRNITIRVKKYDKHIGFYQLTESQAESVMSYIRLITGNQNNRLPAYIQGMVDSHNAVATYYGGTNPND